jgi:hypothetical protein
MTVLSISGTAASLMFSENAGGFAALLSIWSDCLHASDLAGLWVGDIHVLNPTTIYSSDFY